jgi:hypothetical protein
MGVELARRGIRSGYHKLGRGEIVLWALRVSIISVRMVYCSITFNSYSHASHGQKSTKIFVSHCSPEPILALAELAELSRALPADQIA